MSTNKHIPAEVLANRRMIVELSKNDFKTKFAGSYLGIIWAFVQPVVTIFVYWFVFQVGLKQTNVIDPNGLEVPYVLWLIAGLIPWFFFQDATNAATRALVEYSYLVKKVVFNISVLPVVKVVASLFVHLFFMFFMVVMYAVYGIYPSVYMLQMIYYSFAMLLLVIGFAYFNSALVVFFRDWAQIIGIVLNVGIWATPIMWKLDSLDMSPVLKFIFTLNPMYYIVNGYREAFIHHVWFWENPGLTIYYWVFTIVVLFVGGTVFRKLQPHFADVL